MERRRVFITGGTSGIGLALATESARRGAHVWVGSRTASELHPSLEQIRAAAASPEQRIGGIGLDIADRAAVDASRDEVLQALGGLDLLINNAGIATVGRPEETRPEDYEQMMAVNYFGTVWVTRAFAPTLIAQRRGAVCCVASTLGVMGLYGYSAYAASKFAVVGYAECLRQDLLLHGVSVHLAIPGDVDTPQLRNNLAKKPPETRALAGVTQLLTAETVANAILAGIDAGRFRIVIGGNNQAIQWANRVAPWLVRAYIDRALRAYASTRPDKPS